MEPRIATLTVNPAVDLACVADAVRPERKIRTYAEQFDPGGGGINVARVVHTLGGDVLALIRAGGVTGRFVEQMLDELGVPRRSLPIGGPTRISLNVREQSSGLEYRFVPKGPELTEAEWSAALAAVAETEADWLVASGSLPRGVPVDFYARVARVAAGCGQKFVLDTSGAALGAAAGSGIELLKPSLGELETLIGREARDRAAQEAEALTLVRSGVARMVAVSLGRDGALLATPEGVVHVTAPKVAERSAAGAGDSFLAALTLALARGQSPEDAVAWGVAAGAAAVAHDGTAHLKRAEVEELYCSIVRPTIPKPNATTAVAPRGALPLAKARAP